MYLAVAGSCAEDKANASGVEFADLTQLGLIEAGDYGASAIDIVLSPSEIVVGEFATTNTPAKSFSYASEGQDLPDFSSANETLNLTNLQSRGLAFGDNGNYLYVGTNISTRLYRYTLSTPYDIGTAGSRQNSGNIISVPFQGIALHPDGDKMYVVSNTKLYVLTLSTNWQISSGVSQAASFDLDDDTDDDGDTIGGATGIRFSGTGKKMYISYAFDTSNTEAGTQGHSKVVQFNLSTAYEPASRSVASSLDLHPNIGYFSFTPPNPPSQPQASGIRALVSGLDFTADGQTLLVSSAHQDAQSSEYRLLRYGV